MESIDIFNGLLTQPDFYRSTIAHLSDDLFDGAEQIVFNKIKDYSAQYNKQASPADIRLLLKNDMDLTEGETQEALDLVKKSKNSDQIDSELLFVETEKFAQERAFENVLKKAVDTVVSGEDSKITKGMLPDLFRDALSISFSTSLGHDYFRDAPARWEFYTNEEEIIKLDVDALNAMLNGGLRRKSISVWLGRTNIGKCIVGTSEIIVRNKKTGAIEKLTIEEFHNFN